MISKLTFFAGFLTLTLAQVPPTCLDAGLQQAALCTPFITTFCNRVDPEGLPFSDASRRCFNLDNGDRCDFTVLNTFEDGGSPSASNCESVLTNIITNCVRGGQGQFGPGGYTFAVDPGVGACVA